MKAQTVTETLADVLTERADGLHQLAARLRAVALDGSLPPHRLLALSGCLLAQLEDVERSAHQLAAWLPPSLADEGR